VARWPDLQSFLWHLERQGELRRVRVEVDPNLEITEIATRVVREEGPALLFERVRGSTYPLAINIFGSRRRVRMALGRDPGAVGEELAGLVERLNPPTLRGLWSTRGTLRRMLSMRTAASRRALCQEVEEAPDLDALPALTCWPGDGGRFITFPLVLTEDPQTRRRNLGIYRMHIFGRDRTGMHWQVQKGGGFHYYRAEQQGRPLEAAVVLGADPTLMLSAVLPLPEDLDEVAFSGLLRGQPTGMVRARTLSLRVPASAEFVLEGVVPADERETEGPFGDHFGHYSGAAPFPVFHVRRVTRRRNPVYPAAVVGKPPQEDRYLGDAAQEMLTPLIKIVHPELRDLWAYYEAGFHNLLVASVEVRFTKEAMKTALGLLGQGQLALTKVVILVGPEVNVRDFEAVLRAIQRHFNPGEDFALIPRAPLDTLDFTGVRPDGRPSGRMHYGSKMILDATPKPDQPPASEPARSTGGPAPMTVDPAAACPQVRAWRLVADSLLAVQVEGDGRAALQELLGLEGLGSVRMVAAVSPDVRLESNTELLWGIFTRFDPAHDVLFQEVELRGAWPLYRGRLGIDSTFKEGYPEPLAMTEEIRNKVDQRWEEYWR
jgi:4-hydroxy-3-polyprenylbenzoate decarboxylase